MASIDLKSLVGKLDEHCRRALEAAAGLTLSRSHYNVELEHWLLKLVDGNGTDLPLLLRHYDLDEGRFRADLNASLDKMRTGNARAPGLSPDIIELAKAGMAARFGRARTVKAPLRPPDLGAARR